MGEPVLEEEPRSDSRQSSWTPMAQACRTALRSLRLARDGGDVRDKFLARGRESPLAERFALFGGGFEHAGIGVQVESIPM